MGIGIDSSDPQSKPKPPGIVVFQEDSELLWMMDEFVVRTPEGKEHLSNEPRNKPSRWAPYQI